MRKGIHGLNHFTVFILSLYILLTAANPVGLLVDSSCSVQNSFSNESILISDASAPVEDIFISDSSDSLHAPDSIRNTVKKKSSGSNSHRRSITSSLSSIISILVVLLIVLYCIKFIGQVRQKLSIILYIHNQDGQKGRLISFSY